VEKPQQLTRAEPSQDGAAGDSAERFAVELEVLRALCCGAGTLEQRKALLQAVARWGLVEPEHQVVFESLCALSGRKGLSAVLLGVHLNNRGFPDVGMEKYFVAEPPSVEKALARLDELRSPAHPSGGAAPKRASQP
jgi:hypothetical protein